MLLLCMLVTVSVDTDLCVKSFPVTYSKPEEEKISNIEHPQSVGSAHQGTLYSSILHMITVECG